MPNKTNRKFIHAKFELFILHLEVCFLVVEPSSHLSELACRPQRAGAPRSASLATTSHYAYAWASDSSARWLAA